MFIVLHGADDFSSREALRQLLSDPRFAYNIERFEGGERRDRGYSRRLRDDALFE